jgi:hypothetical protein
MKDRMRGSMARSVMRLGPVHVLVVVGSPVLRDAIVAWLKGVKRVRVVRAVASAAQLDGHRVDCDLVVASGLDGHRELREIGRRFGGRAGLVALTLGTSPVPAGWVGLLPGAARSHVLDHAVPHPERSLAASWTMLSAAIVAIVAAGAALVYVPEAGISFQRAALGYAERYPAVGTWWHVWGSGGPYLATASWPLLKAAAQLGGGTAPSFVLLAAAIGALYGVAFLLLALRAGAARYAIVAALVAMLAPALWVWPRGGDIASLAGLAGVVLALAGTRVGRLRLLTTALAVAVSAFGGYLWVATAAVTAVAFGIRADRGRATAAGAVLGILASTAVALPPVLWRGLDGVRPALARPPAISDLVPVIASAALVGVILARGRMRRALIGAAVASLVAVNALALAVAAPAPATPRIQSTGPFGRLAVHPAQALEVVSRWPDLPTTGDEVPAAMMIGEGAKAEVNARLELLGADRAMLPDRSSAIIFNERDWPLVDRDRLIVGAPTVRPLLTAGISATLLVVADEPDARTFANAVAAIGSSTERVVSVHAARSLDGLDMDDLREHTMVVVYGRPWTDIPAAEAILERYLEASGFVYMEAAGRAGAQPLVGEAHTVQASEDQFRSEGDSRQLITAETFTGRIVGIDKWEFRDDPGWERAALIVGARRIVQFGQPKVTSEALAAHAVWSGADLPARAAAGDVDAQTQLRTLLTWMLGASGIGITGGYGRPAAAAVDDQGRPILDNETGKSTFLSPTHWRIELKVATTAVLFKMRYHSQWRAYHVERTALSALESRTPLPIQATANGHMYVTLPPNARTIDFVLEPHPLEGPARGVSAVAVFLTLAVSFFIWRRR